MSIASTMDIILFTRERLSRRIASAGIGMTAMGLVFAWPVSSVSGSGGIAGGPPQTQIPATLDDFFEPGTQELTVTDSLLFSQSCLVCHQYTADGNKEHLVNPYDNWSTSLMAQATRDPVWHAALAIANQDVANSGDTCIRCHSPNGWIAGHSVPTDGSALTYTDFDGVSCNFCHRLVDPIASPANPPSDTQILNDLVAAGVYPTQPGNGRYIIDPIDVRRGPLDDVPENYHAPVEILVSPFHREGNLCGTCHDVSNAMFTRQANGTYALNALGTPHPTGNPHDMMPEQRTFSEWKNSAFNNGGVQFTDGRFGGEHPTGLMQSCQDCHMPKRTGGLCAFWSAPPFFIRPDVSEHSFAGANSWVIGAVFDEYQSDSGLTPELVDLARTRTENMLRAASDVQAIQLGPQMKVRVVNYSGHKLPSGYPEGRRMWVNVQYFNANSDLIAERGAYDAESAVLSGSDTKIYETKLGIGPAVSAATGVPAGESFHLTLNNVMFKDNRIPPIGFTNANFLAVRAEPVAYQYADGQYWDDTNFTIPVGATEAVVTLYYQTTSKEYIEFLRDENVTNLAGQNAYDRWVARGKSAPVDMDVLLLPLALPRPGDVNHNGVVNVDDLLGVINQWGPCPPPTLCSGDVNGNGVINVDDLLLVINNWGG